MNKNKHMKFIDNFITKKLNFIVDKIKYFTY